MNRVKAFPKSYNGTDGMTLRDYFAAQAMQGVIGATGDSDGCLNNYSEDKVAALSYEMADAMLKARKE